MWIHCRKSRKMEGTRLFFYTVLFLSFEVGLCQICDDANKVDSSIYLEESFESLDTKNKTLTLLTVHSEDIYTAGNNGLFHLSKNLEIMSEHLTDEEENLYKILQVSESLGKLVACSSGGARGCQLRSLDDVNVNSSLTNTRFHENAVSSGEFRTVGLIAPGVAGEVSSLYIARSIDRNGADAGNRPVFERTLSGNGNNDRETNAMSTTVKQTFVIYYSDTFSYGGFVYFLASQRDSATVEDSPFVSKLSRVCQNDESDNFKAFAELQLACEGEDGSLYSITQSAQQIGENLYIAFNRNGEVSHEYDPQSQSALCVYNMTEIGKKFEVNSYACACNAGTSTDNGNNNYLNRAECGLIFKKNPTFNCMDFESIRETVSCSANLGPEALFNYPEEPQGQAVSSNPIYESSDLTFSSLLVTSVPRDDSKRIAFIGTKEGKLVKVNLDQTSCNNYEVVNIGDDPILGDTTLYNNESLLVLTESKLLKMKVAECSQFTTCDECIRPGSPLGDPYCGWCTLEKRCTRYDDCPDFNETSRWLPYDEMECVAIAEVTPKALAREVHSQELQLNITHLPELKDGESYKCYFNDWDTDAVVAGDFLNCTSPPMNEIPMVVTGDHVTMQLHIFSSETDRNFVTRDYEFYECSRIESCSQCVNSKWRCDWCKFEHKCTHDSTGCRSPITGSYGSSSNTSSDNCPQIIPGQTKLVPNGVGESFTFRAKNLPPLEDSAVQGYECHLTAKDNCCAEVDFITGATVTAQDNNTFTVMCDEKEYSYMRSQQSLDTKLRLKWNTDNTVDSYQPVELYKCEVDRPDCSRCLSSVTTPENLNCVWCEASSTCTVEAQCDEDDRTLPGTGVCPDPVITKVSPSTSTLGGGTHVTVTGSNLGKAFADIRSISLAGEECAPLEDSYLVGESITCVAGEADQVITGGVVVQILEQSGDKPDSFSYKDPQIGRFIPERGPQSGGTRVEIVGKDLDTGGSVEVSIGGVSCISISPRTADNITCTTEAAESIFASNINVTFDKTESKPSEREFSFEADPTVTSIEPEKTILSGGTDLTVTGTSFDLIQRPQIVATFEGREISENCSMVKDTELRCPSPNVKQENSRKRRQTDNTPVQDDVVIGFILDGVTSLKNWTEENGVTFEYFDDPTYDPFTNNEIEFSQGSGDDIRIEGKNINTASNKEDVKIYIGDGECVIGVFSENQIFCKPPDEQPAAGDKDGNLTARGLPYLIVLHGANLRFNLGYVRYSTDPIIFIIVAIALILIIIIVLAALIIYCLRKSKNKEVELLLLELRDVRVNIGEELRTLFAMLQTAMDKFETNTEVLPVLPLIDRSQYIKNMLFLNLAIQPTMEPPIVSEVEDAMKKFSELISNKSFLLVFIRTLDEEKNLPVMDRVNIASLITLALLLEGKLGYLTDVMLTLTSEHIEELVDKNRQKQLLKRTESIVEKLVSNWIAICLYDYLASDAAEKIVQLYGAIKTVVEKGPIDAVSGKSQFSLSDEHMLEEHIQCEEVTLQVIANEEDGEIASVSVLDVDTITQVKNKILDHLHRGRPYSSRPLTSDMDLEWRQGLSGQLVLRDEGADAEVKDGWKKINTLRDYRVENGCRVALIKKQAHPNAQLANRSEVVADMSDISETSYLQPNAAEKQPLHRSPTLVEARVEEGVSLWHLIKEMEGTDDIQHKSKWKKRRLQRRGIKEVLLPLLPATRNSLQKYVDDAFDVMLSTDQNQVPKCIKYLFDYFDRQASKHNVDTTDNVNAWKNNVLPLRFWTTIMANPTYIFDVRRSRYVEACLRVLVQVLRDACSKSDFKLNKDSSPSRLLYAALLPKYTEQVERYYEHIKDIPRLNPDASKEEFSRICKPFQGIFDPLSTMYQLYQFAKRFNEPLNAALEADDDCQNANLSYRMEQVRITLNE